MDTCSTSLAACLQAIGQFHGCARVASATPGVTWEGLLSEAERCGLAGEYQRCEAGALEKQSLPAIALGVDGRGFILAAIRPGEALIHDPATGLAHTWPLAQLATHWSGHLLVLRSARAGMGRLARFDFTWFIPALVEHRRWQRIALTRTLFANPRILIMDEPPARWMPRRSSIFLKYARDM